MTSRDRKPREVAQQSKSYYDRRDELIEILLAHYHPRKSSEGCISGKPLHPSTPEAVENTPSVSPTSEGKQQVVLNRSGWTRRNWP